MVRYLVIIFTNRDILICCSLWIECCRVVVKRLLGLILKGKENSSDRVAHTCKWVIRCSSLKIQTFQSDESRYQLKRVPTDLCAILKYLLILSWIIWYVFDGAGLWETKWAPAIEITINLRVIDLTVIGEKEKKRKPSCQLTHSDLGSSLAWASLISFIKS